MKPLIDLQDIIKDYRGYRALNGISLQIPPGVTALLGPNGAGKSTLIKVILGLVKLTSGQGTVLGFPLGQQGRAMRTKIGYMPEDDCYISGMSGVEMVRFAACLNGLPVLEGLRRAHETLDFCGVGQERYRDVDGYSTGMRQKAKFAQAIVHDPDFLILDEPTSGLDPEERVSMLNRIQVLSRQHNKSTLISTHILPDVKAICDHIIVIAKGTLRLSASLADAVRPREPGLSVQTVDNNKLFLDQLLKFAWRIEKLDDCNLFVHGASQEDTPVLWRIAKDTNTVISRLQVRTQTLEEVFNEAILAQAPQKEFIHANS